jgi:hypothetical protein
LYSRAVLHHPNIGPNLRTAIDDFAQEMIDDLEAGTFAPEKYTGPAGSRQFTFAPIFSWQLGHTQLDKYTFPPILRQSVFIDKMISTLIDLNFGKCSLNQKVDIKRRLLTCRTIKKATYLEPTV